MKHVDVDCNDDNDDDNNGDDDNHYKQKDVAPVPHKSDGKCP
jgi:hypothetical protein